MPPVEETSRCRNCRSLQLTAVLTLKPSAACDSYTANKNRLPVYPLDLLICDDCGLVQLKHILRFEERFHRYFSSPEVMAKPEAYLKAYANEVLDRKVGPDDDLLVVEIGSHDGSLLKAFRDCGARVAGIEPGEAIAAAANRSGIPTVCGLPDREAVRRVTDLNGPADVVIVDNSFGYQHPVHIANVDNIHAYADALMDLLAPDGTLVVQTTYLGDLINNDLFDYIYHEHLTYFSIETMQSFFFGEYGLNITNIQTDRYGNGRIRFYLCSNPPLPEGNQRIEKLHQAEQQLRLRDANTFRKMEIRIEGYRERLCAELERYRNKKMAGYGASATATTLLYHFGLDDYLSFLVDDNPEKNGLFSPGLNLPVMDPDALYRDEIEIVVILAWRYADRIIERHPRFKGRFIVPFQP